VAAAGDLGGKPYLVTLLALDAGLRLGEATALHWAHVEWERGELRVCQSLSRGKHLGKPKSGHERTVALSKRLRLALMEAWLAAGRPESGAIAKVDHANYRNRTLRDLCKAAGISTLGKRGKKKGQPVPYGPHELRDTYASQLLTAGWRQATRGPGARPGARRRVGGAPTASRDRP
jgi:integrase